ncbi:MAG: PaaI family thioesterase [Phreatobacter sp.]|nr:PaaI family thioesterase [Phreatobacter sp.]
MAAALDDVLPKDPDFEVRARASFARQSMMATLGMSLETVVPGVVEMAMPYAPHILQQHGFVHAGALSALVDNACGFAAMTLMPKGSGVLTVEFKVNMMSPGKGDRFIGIGRVVRPGRTIMVTLGECFAETRGERKLIAMMTATMMVVDSPGIVD